MRLLANDGRRIVKIGALLKVAFVTNTIIVATNAFLGKVVRVNTARVPNNQTTRRSTISLATSLAHLKLHRREVGANAPPHISHHSIRFSSAARRCNSRPHKAFSCLSAPSALPRRPYCALRAAPRYRSVLHTTLPRSPLCGNRVRDVKPHCYPSVRAGLAAFPSGSDRPLFLRPRNASAGRVCLGNFSSSVPVSVRLTTLQAVPTLESVIVCHPTCTVRCSYFSPARLARSLRSGMIPNLFLTKRIGNAANCRRTTTRKLVTNVGTTRRITRDAPFALTESRTCVNILVSSLIAGNISRPCHVFASQTRCHVLLQRSGTSTHLATHKRTVRLTAASE